MKYLKKYNNYTEYLLANNPDRPLVSHCVNENTNHFKPVPGVLKIVYEGNSSALYNCIDCTGNEDPCEDVNGSAFFSKIKVNGTVVNIADIDSNNGVYDGLTSGDNTVEFTLKEGITSINGKLFKNNTALKSVIIPKGINSIENEAFKNTTNLESITFPKSLLTIGDDVFNGCGNLETVNFSNYSWLQNIGSKAFRSCSSLTNMVVPNGVNNIGSGAFAYSGLTSVTLPDTLTSMSTGLVGVTNISNIIIPRNVSSIEDDVFYQCNSLTSVTIPENVIQIGNSIFGKCENISSVVVDSNNQIYDSRDNCNAIIETASNTLVNGCKTSTIPNTVTIIGKDAFCDIIGKSSINIPNSVTTIKEEAFIGMNDLTSIVIPESVINIENFAFGFTPLVESIVVNSNNSVYDSRNNCNAIIKTSNNYLIAGCKNTIIPSTVKRIDDGAFYGISSLTNIDLPEGITVIRNYAFSYTGLISIVIPSTVTAINYCSFYGCSSLRNITVLRETTVPFLAEYAFDGLPNDFKIFVPAAVVNSYKTATTYGSYTSYWSQYADHIYPITTIEA